ncbi:MAG: hypothetical protein KGO96_09295 [Elusimicrobia bacterium]|nr:hypothetical protein [Elusimicrobiota bacterium]MDE2236698.1 hypothetical protein [Elusimicrobiota bacterium]MDE2426084.1 hypothetical protein [Elusimicrobiota bacterium]
MRTAPAAVWTFLALAAALARPAAAATSGGAPISVTIQSIDVLSVTDSGPLNLQASAGSNVLSGPADSSARLNLSHNSATALRITAEVLPADDPPSQDITLTVSVAGGSGQKTLVLSGGAQGPQEVYSSIPAGVLTDKAVTYTASCTASGTKVSAATSFDFVVTFTTLN